MLSGTLAEFVDFYTGPPAALAPARAAMEKLDELAIKLFSTLVGIAAVAIYVLIIVWPW